MLLGTEGKIIHVMKVPEPVKKVFDTFPLQQFPKHEEFASDDTLLAVYNIDLDGLPTDPRCLEFFSILVSAGAKFQMKVLSPLISNQQSLPVYFNKESPTDIFTKPSELAKNFFPKCSEDPTYLVYRSLLETWIDDAAYVLLNEPQKTIDLPYPFSYISNIRHKEQLSERHKNFHKGSGDDYVFSIDRKERFEMSLNALEDVVSDDLAPLNLLVFSYIYPLSKVIEVPTKLQEHSLRVRDLLIEKLNN